MREVDALFQILVVEDGKSSARLMKAVLERAGYAVFRPETDRMPWSG